ncbi:MAG: class I SAM-dependent methyltransferase [Alphaproteobacteria bacterium]|nr:class I SAM-dependent methyltransferase [Alphaproteobacteria bacterium]
MSENYFGSIFFGIARRNDFLSAVHSLLNSLRPEWNRGVFAGDNLITFGKNLSFRFDKPFMRALEAHAHDGVEKSIIWRTAILVWAARNGLRRDGDFVECGCYRGTSARIICDTIDINNTNKAFYLYDMFDYREGSPHAKMPGMCPELYDEVCQKFASIKRASVIKGEVPDILNSVSPDRISFLHIDMNNAASEIGALNRLFERVTPGGMIVLDDYGYLPYRAQRDAERQWFAERGYDVMELPKGQGLVIK